MIPQFEKRNSGHACVFVCGWIALDHEKDVLCVDPTFIALPYALGKIIILTCGQFYLNSNTCQGILADITDTMTIFGIKRKC